MSPFFQQWTSLKCSLLEELESAPIAWFKQAHSKYPYGWQNHQGEGTANRSLFRLRQLHRFWVNAMIFEG
jgi:hypothetical protein